MSPGSAALLHHSPVLFTLYRNHHSWHPLQARRRMMKESMLPARDPEKGPLIGRDRSAALRRNDMPTTSIQHAVDSGKQSELPVSKPVGNL